MTRFREIPSLFHSSATQQISFSIMAIITLALLTFFYWHTPLLFTTLCIFQYLFCIQISKTQFKSLCIYFPGEDIYFTSGVQSIIIIYIYNIILFLWHSIEHFKYIIRLFKQDRHRFGYFTKKLVEKTLFLAIIEGNRCVTYSDDGTVLEMFIGLATMENWRPFICPASILAHLDNRHPQ